MCVFFFQTYKNNLQKLEALVLVKFENDTMVQPIESEWFGFYKPGQSVELETLQESILYTEVINFQLLIFKEKKKKKIN